MRRISVLVAVALLAACNGAGGSGSSSAPSEPAVEGRNGDRMVFADPGVNTFADAAEDARSTFAVDVDTASYTVARRYVTDGALPPPASVRVEEFVNYFDQDYPAPEEEAFRVSVDGAPTPFLSDPDNRLLRVGLQSRRGVKALRRRAALTFVVDVSGSMAEENRLGLVRESLKVLTDELRRTDTVAIVAYSDDADLVLPPTPVTRSGRIVSAIDQLQPQNATNVAAGLRLGYEVARANYRPGDINRVVLASDGLANVGVTRPRALLNKVEADAEAGIQLVTVGVGMGNYNDVLLEQLADNGDGFYAYVDSFAEAQRVFSETVTTTLDVVALDTKIQVEFSDAVTRYRLVGFENRAVRDDRFRDDSVDAGAVGPGHTVTALYEVTLERDAPAAPLATVRVRWTDPATNRPRELAHVAHGRDLHGSFDAAPATLRLDATAAAYAEVLRNSPYAKQVTLHEVAREASDVGEVLIDDSKVAEFVSLTKAAARVSR